MGVISWLIQKGLQKVRFIDANPWVALSAMAVSSTNSTRKMKEEMNALKLRLCYASLLDEFWLPENVDRIPVEGICSK